MKRFLSLVAFGAVAFSMAFASGKGTIRKSGKGWVCDIEGGDTYAFEPYGRTPTQAEQLKCIQAGGKIKSTYRAMNALNVRTKTGGGMGMTLGQKRRICSNYTRSAISAQRANLQLRCGYRGNGWTTNPRAHFAWCLKAKLPLLKRETAKRNAALNACKKKSSHCHRYASIARAQQVMNLKSRCGFRGSYWSTSTNVHYAYCMRAGLSRVSRLNSLRANALRKCQAKKRVLKRRK